MQTPPDIDDSGARREDAEPDDDDNVEVLSDRAFGRNHRRHLESSTYAARTTTQDKQTARRQKRAANKQHPPVLTPESGPDVALVLHKPSSATTRLRVELVDMMVRTHRSEIWYDLLPARIGHSDAIDSAAKALIKASDLASRRTNVTEESCLSSYNRAITSVRDGMIKSSSGDDLLCAVALLVNFERLFSGWTSAPMRSHMHGIMAIFMAQSKGPHKPPSELTRTLVYTFWAVGFIGPCVMGTASPLEVPRYLDLEPVPFAKDKMSCPWNAVAKLRKLGNQQFIRLPRLIMLFKGVQSGKQPQDLESAVLLAKELLEMHDDAAETEMLHHVMVQKAEEDPKVETMPYLMKFTTMGEFEAAMHYWSTQIILLRLCWRMSRLFSAKYESHGLWSKSRLETQISRMSANVLMAAPWGLNKGETGRSCEVLDLVAVWGALNDFDVFAARKLAPAKARSLLLYAGQIVMGISGESAAAECADRLSAAAELFIGGQSSGILAFTFKKSGPSG